MQIITEEAELRPAEEIYDEAMALINCNDADSLKAGLTLMEEICNRNYVPALWQTAYTYGWFSDTASVNRKRLLGIEMDQQFLPVDKDYSSRAMNDLNRIKELNDSSYADINAKAAFRLACYYVMENKLIRKDLKEGKEYLLTAREWAVLAENDSLLRIIDAGLATF